MTTRQLHNGQILIRYEPGSRIVYVDIDKTEVVFDDARSIIETVLEITGEDKFGIVSDFSKVAHISVEARRLLSERHERLIAIGTVIGSVAQKLMINMMLQLFPFKYKFKYFTDKSEAEQWVKQQIDAAG